MAQFASISFDIAVEEIFPTWIAGGALVVREEDASLAVGDFLRWVDEKRVTALDLPTAYWHELVRELSESAISLPKSLRIVIVGGEKASAAALATWRKLAGPRVRWVNTYGPTETSVIVTSYEPKASEELPAVLPIGRPIANTRIYILGKNLQPLPVGIAGDLYVSGPGLARGYLNRPEITAEKFVSDPFSTEPGARMYKTGDLARYLASGEIEFAGRTDDQVKIRGYRVELEEIEAVLGSHPGVREVVVIARENASGEKNLVAYVVPSREQVPTASELRSYLKQKLPHYMVPSAFVLLEAMPKTPNGKVDKRAMPAPKQSDFAETQEYVAPTDELETQLTKIWETVLDKTPIGIRDNFFELGGHSLLAARLMHRIEQSIGQRLPLAALLQAPTIEQLSGLLRQEQWSSSWSSLVAIQAEGSRPPFFLCSWSRGKRSWLPRSGAASRSRSAFLRAAASRPGRQARMPDQHSGDGGTLHSGNQANSAGGSVPHRRLLVRWTWWLTRWRSSWKRRARKWRCWRCLTRIRGRWSRVDRS